MVYGKVFVNFKVLFKCKALLLIICISYDIILYVCFAAAFFSLQISLLQIQTFTVLFILLHLEQSFFELTSDQLSLPICACQNVTLFSKPVLGIPFFHEIFPVLHNCPLTS